MRRYIPIFTALLLLALAPSARSQDIEVAPTYFEQWQAYLTVDVDGRHFEFVSRGRFISAYYCEKFLDQPALRYSVGTLLTTDRPEDSTTTVEEECRQGGPI